MFGFDRVAAFTHDFETAFDLIRKGHFKKGERVVFLHTGGAAALFGYDKALTA